MQMRLFDPDPAGERPADKNLLLGKLTHLLGLYESGKLGGTFHEVHPGLDRGSTENYLYFTLAPALNYQRKSEGLWQAALRTYNDPATQFVFDPAAVVTELGNATGRERVLNALRRHKLALQPVRQTYTWVGLCDTLATVYNGCPKHLLQSCDNDVIKVLELLGSNKSRFPYLSGPKLSNYWLYILSIFTDVRLKNRQEISIIPDTHVIRATCRLGLIAEGATAHQVAEVWKKTLQGTDLAPSDLHAPLWRWSRRGFKPELTEAA